MRYSAGSWMQMWNIADTHLLKTVKALCCDDCQFSNRLVIVLGKLIGAVVFPTQTCWVVYSMHLLSPRTKVGIVMHLRWGRHSPPLFVDMLLIRRAWVGTDLRLESLAMKLL